MNRFVYHVVRLWKGPTRESENSFELLLKRLAALFVAAATTGLIVATIVGIRNDLTLLQAFFVGLAMTTFVFVIVVLIKKEKRQKTTMLPPAAAPRVNDELPWQKSAVINAPAEPVEVIKVTTPPTEPQDATVIVTKRPRHAGKVYREADLHSTGDGILTISKWEETTAGNHKKQWELAITRLNFHTTRLVDPRLVARRAFSPIETEKEIRCFTRLHWWSHGPKQILTVLLGLLGLAASSIGFAYSLLSPDSLAIFLVTWIPLWVITYLWVWIKWAYTYLIITDKRILLVYAPPLWIPGGADEANITGLQGIAHRESYVGNALGFATVYSETTATKIDKWMRDGIKYVPRHQEVKVLLAS